MLAHAGDSTMASAGRERGQHHGSASSIVSTATQGNCGMRVANAVAKFAPGRTEQRRAAGVTDDFRSQRREIGPLALPAGQKPNRHLQRPQGGDGRLGRGGRRIVVEAAALDDGKPFQPLREGAKLFQSPPNRFPLAAGGHGRRSRTGRVDPVVPARHRQSRQSSLQSRGSDTSARPPAISRPRTSGDHEATSTSKALRTAISSGVWPVRIRCLAAI